MIHPKAHVENCIIGAGTTIWQFASVMNTTLGDDCSVAPGAMLDGPVFGDRCRIGPSVSMGPGFVVGDDCFIGPSVTLCNDAWPRADKGGFDAEALRDGSLVAVRVGKGVSIGANAVILPGVTIGDGAFVAAGAVVHCDVPPMSLWRRDGMLLPITDARRMRRMRAAR